MRIIYNTSFILHPDIEQEWVAFVRKHYVLPVQENPLCKDVIFTKVSIDQPEGKTYSIQLIFDSQIQQEHFVDHILPSIEEKIARQYCDRYVSFSSILREI